MGIVEFLNARIGEDEVLARAEVVRTAGGSRRNGKATALRLALECQAKRRIVEVVAGWHHLTVEDCWYSCASTYGTEVEDACCNDAKEGSGCDCGLNERVALILRPLAAVYSGHEDYRDDW